MEVYFGAAKNEKAQKKPGKPIPIHQQFSYGERLWLCPMAYLFDKGLILDLCRQFDAKEYQKFYTKWADQADSQEPARQEQLEYENPMNFDCMFTLSVNGKKAGNCGYSGTAWQPYVPEAADPVMEKVMEEYGLSRDCGWYFYRISYSFSESGEKDIKSLSLCITARKRRIFFAEEIKTDVNCDPFEAKLCHPLTGESYIFHAESCTAKKLTEKTSQKSVTFPTNYCLLKYHITPETSGDEQFLVEDVRPCAPPIAEYDVHSQREVSCVTILGGADGPTSVFLAGKIKNQQKEENSDWETTASALTLEPVKNVTWKFSLAAVPFKAQTFCLLSEGDTSGMGAAMEV